MSIAIELKTNAPQIAKQLERALAVVKDGTRDPDINAAFKRVGARLLGFERRRFLTLSRSGGGGEWKDLAIATKMRRLSKTKTQRGKLDKRVKKEGKASRAALLRQVAATIKLPIMVDTGLLINSLTLGAQGNVNETLLDGVKVGTRVRYAGYHQDPQVAGRPPRRTIIAPPDQATTEQIQADINAGVLKAIARRFSQ